MDDYLGDAMYWIVAHKWWLIAAVPIAIVLIVMRALSPR